jgi:hypothetical protein
VNQRASLPIAVGLALLIFTLGLIPGVTPPIERNEKLYELAESSLRSEAGGAQPGKADVERRYEGFMTEQWLNWIENSALLALSVAAIVLTAGMGKRLGFGWFSYYARSCFGFTSRPL